MPASTISHNTPAAGSISWTAFNIAYNGVGYPIPAGSTAGRFVWWEYRNGSPLVKTGDTLPALTADDTVLFLNKGGIGQLLPETSIIDGSLIVEESILANAIGANQINGGHIESDSIQTKHLGAGVVTAEQLSVGTVSANLVANGSFEDFDESGTIVGWEIGAMTNGTIQPVTGVASSGAVAIQFAPSTATANLRLRQTPAQFIPVSSASSRRWYVSARMGVGGTATSNGSYIRVNWYDGNRVFVSSTDVRANGGLSTTFAIYEGQVAPPATARFMGLELMIVNPSVTSNAYVDEVTVYEVVVAAQIGDGQITTPKLVAGSVTADKILLSDWTNYWSNPDYEGDTANAQPRGISSNTSCRVKDISAMNTGNGSAKALEIDAKSGSNNDVFDLNVFPVQPGDQFYVRFQGRHANTVGTGVTGIGFRTFDAKKAGITWTRVAEFGATKTTTWTEKDGVYTVPNGTYFLQPWATFANNAETTNKFYVDNVSIRRMAGGELIVDGAIDGMVITGPTIRTAAEGARVQLDDDGLHAFDADNNETVKISAVDGTLSATGALSSTGEGKDFFTGVRSDIKATLGNKLATNSWVGYDFLQPGVYFERDSGTAQPLIETPRVVSPRVSDVEMSSAQVALDSAKPNEISHGSVSAGPGYSSMGSKRYDRTINSDGGNGLNGILEHCGILTNEDAVMAYVEDSQADYRSQYSLSIGGKNTDGTGGVVPTPPGVQLKFETGYGDPAPSDALVRIDRDGILDVKATKGAATARMYATGDGKLRLSGTGGIALESAATATSLTATGTVQGATVKATGALQGATASITGALTAGTLNGEPITYADITPTGVTFATGYGNYAGFQAPAYYRDAQRVWLMGLLGTTYATITLAPGAVYQVATIPASHAPAADVLFNVAVGPQMDARTFLYVRASGSIEFYSPASVTLSKTNFYIGLEGVSWFRKG